MAAEPATATTRSFHKRLYKLDALKEAIEAYGDFATLALDRGGDAWTVTFSDVDPDFAPEVFASEFANYVLAGTIQQAR